MERVSKNYYYIIRGYIKESPYVGVFYLNELSGAFGNGHVALMLVHEDRTGDIYSFVGTTAGFNSCTTVAGYNDAFVEYAYKVDIDDMINRGINSEEKVGKYSTKLMCRNDETKLDGVQKTIYRKYDNGIYIPVDNEKGKLIAAEAEKTKSEVNTLKKDPVDYNLFTNNCDINARKWLKAGGIEIFKDDMMPNATYINTVDDIRNGKIKGYRNIKYGDLYDVWTRIQKECISSE